MFFDVFIWVLPMEMDICNIFFDQREKRVGVFE